MTDRPFFESLRTDVAHVWFVRAPSDSSVLPDMIGLLSDKERARLSRLRLATDQRHFAVAHTALRRILSWYVGVDARQLVIHAAPGQKPFLGAPASAAPVCFNLSHSADACVVAVSVREVGVDVERVNPLAELDGMTRMVCSPAERRLLGSLPPTQVLEVFYRCWTLKEALSKALGVGLRLPFAQVDLATHLGASNGGGIPHVTADGRRWYLHSMSEFPGFASALALPDGPQAPRVFTIDAAELARADSAPMRFVWPATTVPNDRNYDNTVETNER
jgi:4'-phosphopantetheinyl transferase